jgi:membrane protein YdbS with pleckstrin-like domain
MTGNNFNQSIIKSNQMSKQSYDYSRVWKALAMLTIIFILLRLFKVIDWSWLGVFAPLWIPVALAVAFGAIAGVIAFFGAIWKEYKKEKIKS